MNQVIATPAQSDSEQPRALKTRQALKYHLSLAGEFQVAAQLQRLGVSASVTYGNAKNADVIVFNDEGSKAVVVEVKSTSQSKWVVGSRVPASEPKPWVFVYFPTDTNEPPRYYVFLQSDLHDLLAEEENAYFLRYEQRHGRAYGDRAGVVNLARAKAEPYRNAWHKIIDLLRTCSQSPQ